MELPATLSLRADQGVVTASPHIEPASPESPVERTAGGGPEPEAEGSAAPGRTDWKVELGAATAVRLTVSPQRLPSRPGVRQRTVYRFQGSVVEVVSDVELDGRSPQWDRLELLLGPELRLLSAASGEQALNWDNASPERATVRLDAIPPGADSIRLVGVVERPQTPAWRLPSFYIANAIWQESEAVLVIPDALELLRLEMEGARQIGRSSQADATEIFVRHDSPEATLEMSLRARRPQLVSSSGASIRWASDRLTADVVCRTRTDWGEVFELAFQWPAAPRLDRWTVDSFESEPAGYIDPESLPQIDAQGVLRAPLLRAVSADDFVTFRIRAHRRRPANQILTGSQMLVGRLLGSRRLVDLLAVEGTLSGDGLATRVEPRTGAAAELLSPLPGGNTFQVDHRIGRLTSRPDDQRASYAAELAVDATIRGGLLEEVYRVRCRPSSEPLQEVLVQISGSRATPIRWSLDGSDEDIEAQLLPDARETEAAAVAGRPDEDREADAPRGSRDRLAPSAAASSPPGSGARPDSGLAADRGAAAAVERWSVRTPRPLQSAFTLVGRRTTPFASGTRNILLASVPAAVSQSGQVTLRCADDAGIRVADTLLEPVPGPLRNPDQRSQVRGLYRYEPARPTALVVARDPEQLKGLLWCWRSQHVSRYERAGHCLNDVVFHLENHGRGALETRLPADCELEFVEVDGQRVKVAPTAGACRIPLPRKVAVAVHLQYVTRHPTGVADGWRGELVGQLAIPQVPVLESTWQIVLPPEYRTSVQRSWRQRLLGPWQPWPQEPQVMGWNRVLDRWSPGAGGLRTWGDLAAALEQAAPQPLYVAAQRFADRGVAANSPLPADVGSECRVVVTDDLRAVLQPAAPANGGAADKVVTAREWMAEAPGLWRDRLSVGDVDYPGWFAETRPLSVAEQEGGAARATFYHTPTWLALNWAVLLIAAGAAATLPRFARPWLLSALGIATICAPELPAAAAGFALWGVLGGVLVGEGVAAWRRVPPPGVAAAPTALLLLASAVAACSLSTADDDRDPGAALVYRILQPLDRQGNPTKRYYVSPDFYNRFEDELAPAAEAAPKQWLIESADYQLRLPSARRQRPELTAELVVKVLEPNSEVRVQLPRNGARLRRTSVDGQPAAIRWTADGSHLVFAAPTARRQRLQVVWDLAMPEAADDDGWLRVLQAIPSVPRARVRIEHSGDQPVDIEAPTARGAVTPTPAGLMAELGPAGELEARWRPAAERGAIQVEQLSWMRVLPSSVQLENQFRFRNSEAEMNRLRIRVDRRLRLLEGTLEVDGRENVQAKVVKQGGQTMLEVPLDPPSDEVVLHAAFHAVEFSGVGRLPMPMLEAVSDVCSQRWLGVTLHSSLDPTPAHGVDLTPLPADDFALAWGAEELPTMAFRLPLQADPRDDARIGVRYGELPGAASEQRHLLFSGDATRVRYDAQIQGMQGQRFQFEIEASPILELESVEVSAGGRDVPHQVARDDRGTITILLSKTGRETHTIGIDALAPAPSRNRRDRQMPRLKLKGLPVEDSRTYVYRARDLVSVRARATSEQEPAPSSAFAWPQDETATLVWSSSSADADNVRFQIVRASLAGASADLLTSLTRLDGQWKAEALAAFQLRKGPPVDTIRLEAPQAWPGPYVIEPAADHWVDDIPGKPQRKQILIRLRQPWKGGTTPLLRIQGPLREQGAGSLAAPRIELKDVPLVRSFLALPRQAEGQQIDWLASGLQAAPAPARLIEALPPGLQVDTYRPQRRFNASVRTMERVAGAPLVRLADVHLAWQRDGRQFGVVHFDVEPAGARFCDVASPAGVRLIELVLDGVTASRTRSGSRTRVRLGPDQLPQRLTVVFAGSWSSSGAARGGELDWPVAGVRRMTFKCPTIADMDTARTLWTVYGPPNLQGPAPTLAPAIASAASSPLRHEMLRLETTSNLVEVAADPLAVRRSEEIESWYAPWAHRLLESYRRLTRLPQLPSPQRQRADSFLQQQEQLAVRLRMQSWLRQEQRAQELAMLPTVAAWESLRPLQFPQRAIYQGAVSQTDWRWSAVEKTSHWALGAAIAAFLLLGLFGGRLGRVVARWPRLASVLCGLALAALLPWPAIGWALVGVSLVVRR